MSVRDIHFDKEIERFWFIIPLKSKLVSKNWQFVCCLLERTIASILRQTDRRFGIVVVHHEMPDLPPVISDCVHFIKADYPAPSAGSTRLQKNADKFCKHAIGLREIFCRNAEYYMFVDADDLVSSAIVEDTFTRKPQTGILLKTGIVFDEPSQLLWKVLRFNRLCGTSTIFRFDKTLPELLPKEIKPDPLSDDSMPSFVGKIYSIDFHTRYEDNVQEQGLHLDEWHTPYALYRWNHGDHTNVPKAFRLGVSKKLRHYLPLSLSKRKRWQPAKLDLQMRQAFNLF